MKMHKLLGAAITASMIAAVPASAQDIKIGANLPMSGPNAEYGELFSSAAAIAGACAAMMASSVRVG